DNIRDHDVDVGVILLGGDEGFQAVTRLNDVITETLQRFGSEGSKRKLIFHEKDRAVSRRGFLYGCSMGLLRRPLDSRQVDRERGADADFAVDGDVPAALFDNSVHGGEAQAGALPRFLGREEWLEDLCESIAVHPAAVI